MNCRKEPRPSFLNPVDSESKLFASSVGKASGATIVGPTIDVLTRSASPLLVPAGKRLRDLL